MSTRMTKFNQEILSLWKEIESSMNEINAAGLSVDNLDEIARLKKVITYLSEMLTAIDPDLVPVIVFNKVKSPISEIKNNLTYYINTNNIGYITNANNNLDTLLIELMPFIFYKGKAASALQKALNQYSETILEHAQSYLANVKSSAQETESLFQETKSIVSDLSEKQERFTEYSEQLFEDDGIKSKISSLVDDFEEKNSQIIEFHQKIFDPKDGIEEQIKNYLSDGKSQNEKLHSLKENSSHILDKLDEFYDEVFGKENKDGNLEGGLKNELEIRKNELDKFKLQQQERYQELNTQIENLLPGATSAGLSSAYHEMYEKFNDEVKSYGKWFYGALGILFLVIIVVTSIHKSNESNTFNQVTATVTIQNNEAKGSSEIGNKTKTELAHNDSKVDNNQTSNVKEVSLSNRIMAILDSLIYKLPFILPALWLVLFVSRRRNEAQRLAQEYAHKEALAKSYDSYKQQIEKLSEENRNELLPKLMDNMLKAIALNPAETLDKNHKEQTPIEEVIKKKEFWDFIEKVKNLMPTKKE
ncbi:hypothetical protein NYR62_05915 [Actinobacillus genomosp. 1]|uniref:hypothetical protein n=1 Tax=Actinobacillus genomosp. 1 TaxID=254839 RepID=UPI0024419AF2|nr:hypothetical protein [Actinobacillus genomosp. 1]WGE35174.1 hypothetical protein NYR62_05915 [Actinobacillus genomosp. 1]